MEKKNLRKKKKTNKQKNQSEGTDVGLLGKKLSLILDVPAKMCRTCRAGWGRAGSMNSPAFEKTNKEKNKTKKKHIRGVPCPQTQLTLGLINAKITGLTLASHKANFYSPIRALRLEEQKKGCGWAT